MKSRVYTTASDNILGVGYIKPTGTSQNNVEATGKGAVLSGDSFPSLSTHHNSVFLGGVGCCLSDVLEELEIGREVPRQFAVFADTHLFGCSYNDLVSPLRVNGVGVAIESSCHGEKTKTL